MLTVLFIILALGLVIFVHELGHFIICKIVGIRVLRFAFGFGPEIAGVNYKGTRYGLCAFPLGGFVQPAGEDPEEVTGAPDEFFSKSWKARIAVAFGGPAMNYVLAFILFWSIFWVFGLPELSSEAVIGSVLEGSPAAVAGFEPGDRVISVVIAGDSKSYDIVSWQNLSEFIHVHPEKALTVTAQREGAAFKLVVTPKRDGAKNIGLIGITPQVRYAKVGVFAAAGLSFKQVLHWSFASIAYIWDKLKQGKKVDLAGPVGIVTMMGKAVKSGLNEFLSLIGMISIAIGFFNLFPIPLLDGGHVALYLWEGLSRRRLTKTFLIRANSVGLAILVPIFIFAFYNDIERLWSSKIKKVSEFQQYIEQ